MRGNHKLINRVVRWILKLHLLLWRERKSVHNFNLRQFWNGNGNKKLSFVNVNYLIPYLLATNPTMSTGNVVLAIPQTIFSNKNCCVENTFVELFLGYDTTHRLFHLQLLYVLLALYVMCHKRWNVTHNNLLLFLNNDTRITTDINTVFELHLCRILYKLTFFMQIYHYGSYKIN